MLFNSSDWIALLITDSEDFFFENYCDRLILRFVRLFYVSTTICKISIIKNINIF